MTSITYQPIRSLKNDVTSIAMVTMMSHDPSRPIKSLKNVVEYQFVGPLICDLNVTFQHGSVRMFLVPFFRHISHITKIYGLLQLINYYNEFLHYCVISIDSYISNNKFYSFLTFNFIINVNLLLNGLVFILCLYICFVSSVVLSL